MTFHRNTQSWRMPWNGSNEYEAERVRVATKKANAALRLKGLLFLNPTLGKRDKETGVISIDIAFQPTEWLSGLFQKRESWYDHTFPSLEMYSDKPPEKESTLRVRFFRKGQLTNSIQKMLAKVTKQETFAAEMCPYELIFTRNPTELEKTNLQEFLASKKLTTALVALNYHTKVCFKDTQTNELKIYDPWMKTMTLRFPWIADMLREVGMDPKARYVKPEQEDQLNEPSCTLVSMMRALMIVLYGFEQGTESLHTLMRGEKKQELLSCIVAAQLLAPPDVF